MTVVRVLAVGDPAVGVYTDESRGILRRFTETSGITTQFDVLPWDRYSSTLFSEAARAEPDYDVVMVAGHLWLAHFSAQGWLLPLDDFSDFADPSFAADDILPVVDAELRISGRRFLTPSFSDGHLLYANASGVVHGDGTAVDPLRFAELANTVSGFRAPLICKAAASEIFLDWIPYLRSAGGEVFSPEGEPLFNSSEGRESLNYYLSLRSHLSEVDAPYGNEEVARALRESRVGFGMSWGGQAGVIVRRDPDAAPMHYATVTHPWNVTWSFGILSGSAHPRAAAALLAWLSGPEVDRMVGEYAGSPCRRSSYAGSANTPWHPAQLNLLERARPLPSHPRLADMIGPLYGQIFRAWEGEATAAEALAGAEREVREVLQG